MFLRTKLMEDFLQESESLLFLSVGKQTRNENSEA